VNNVRALLISIANEARNKQARGELPELTPEVIAGFILRDCGDDARLFVARVHELVDSSFDDAAPAPSPSESAPVRKRGPLRLVR
jgi:hypothetical protein